MILLFLICVAGGGTGGYKLATLSPEDRGKFPDWWWYPLLSLMVSGIPMALGASFASLSFLFSGHMRRGTMESFGRVVMVDAITIAIAFAIGFGIGWGSRPRRK